jgi:NTE family protein
LAQLEARAPVTNGESSDHQDAPWRSSLALIEAFRDLPPRQLADLEQRLIALSVRRGEVLVREGDSADALYLVVSGRFAVDVDGRHVAEVGSGAPIGEVAFFADGRRTATVMALRDSLVLKLPHADFVGLAESYPAILKPIMVTLARRLADTLAGEEQTITSHPRTIAVIGAGPSPVPEEFRRGLTRALARYGEVEAIDAGTVAAAFPNDPTLESDAVTTWLNKQDSATTTCSMSPTPSSRRSAAKPSVRPTNSSLWGTTVSATPS